MLTRRQTITAACVLLLLLVCIFWPGTSELHTTPVQDAAIAQYMSSFLHVRYAPYEVCVYNDHTYVCIRTHYEGDIEWVLCWFVFDKNDKLVDFSVEG